MNKQEQMIEYTIQDLIELLCDSQNIDYITAMNLVYNSQLFEKIQDPQTGLYRESPAYVFSLLSDEMLYGKIIQTEF
ncbi:MAG: hypothetical protein J6M93_05525 [Succinivibrio sp.]|nr:hypothetical protein [Succinivibrio sp.]